MAKTEVLHRQRKSSRELEPKQTLENAVKELESVVAAAVAEGNVEKGSRCYSVLKASFDRLAQLLETDSLNEGESADPRRKEVTMSESSVLIGPLLGTIGETWLTTDQQVVIKLNHNAKSLLTAQQKLALESIEADLRARAPLLDHLGEPHSIGGASIDLGYLHAVEDEISRRSNGHLALHSRFDFARELISANEKARH